MECFGAWLWDGDQFSVGSYLFLLWDLLVYFCGSKKVFSSKSLSISDLGYRMGNKRYLYHNDLYAKTNTKYSE